MPHDRCALAVMIKVPRVGAVKTRLVPPLTGEQAASLAACFARDAASGLRRVVPEMIVAYAPSDGRAALERLFASDDERPSAPSELLWLEQRGEDLGARLEAAAAHAFGLGRGPVVIVGADSPTLPPSFVGRAVRSLAAGEADIALGPTEDGGFYLVGLSRPSPGLFQHVAWSTPSVYRQTAGNAARLGLRALELPRWYDVDTYADLLRLREEIFRDESARLRAPATHGWLLTHAPGLPPSA